MNRRSSLGVAAALWLTVSALSFPEAAGQNPARPADVPASEPVPRAVLDRYCVTCHNSRAKSGGLVLEKIDLSDVGAHSDTWEKVVRKVRAGHDAPARHAGPAGRGQAGASRARSTTQLDRAALASPQPGRPLVHRLNRAEYANAIRDLLALEIDPAPLLPADDSSAGFDNIADVLGLSPVLLESYLSAAGRISALAIGDPKTPPMGEVYRVRQDASQSRHVEGLPLGTVGGFEITRNIPLDGEYAFQVKLFRTNLGTMRGLEFPHQLEISVDGQRVHLASFGGDRDVRASSDNPTTTGDEIDNRFSVRLPLKAGPRRITVAFIEKTHGYNTRRLQSYVRSSADTIDFSGYPHIDQFIMTGPFSPTGTGETPSRRAIFTCRPATVADEAACARKILQPLARRAYRGDMGDADLQVLLDFFARGREGVRHASTAASTWRCAACSRARSSCCASSPIRRASLPGAAYRLSDLALASRLSFFLWSSIPDDDLLNAAAKRRAEEAGGARSAGAAHARGPEGARARREFRGPVAAPPQPAQTSSRIRSSSPTSTTTCAAR